MSGSTKHDRAQGGDPDHRDTSGGRQTKAKAVYNPKGIGSNVLLTAAAAVVPLVIVGVAGATTFFGAKRSKR